jgi:hypothetical protein
MNVRAIAWAAMLFLVPPPGPLAGAAPARIPSAAAIVEGYNARNFGSPGWRRIVLELKDGAKITRSFTILHLWEKAASEVRSLVLLEEPVNLRGTNYLLLESLRGGTEAGMRLFLFLPAGKRRVLTIRPSRFDEGLLGSDFSYSDLRWVIPAPELRLRVAGTERMLGRTAWVIEAVPMRRQDFFWSRVRYFIGQDPVLLLGADFYGASDGQPAKRLRVEGIRKIGETWTPTRMVMRLEGRRSSVLTLADAGFGAMSFPPDLFQPDNLPAHGDRLRAGRPVADLTPGVRP